MADQKKTFELPTIELAKSYRSWRFKLVSQLKLHDAWEGVKDAIEDEDATEPIWPPATVAVQNKRKHAYNLCYAAMAKSIKLDSEIDILLTSHECENVIDSLRLLDKEFLELQTIQLNNLSHKFNTVKWDYKKSSLSTWMTEKWSQILKLTEEYPSEESRHFAMCRVLTELVPKHFSEVTNRFRVERPDTWRKLETALKDYETASPMEKTENQGKSFHTRLEKMEKMLNKDDNDAHAHFVNGYKGKGKGKKGFGKKGFGKKGYGHYNGGGKHGGNYVQKKGGKGKFVGNCHNCGGAGHTSKFCPSPKDYEKIKKNRQETAK